MSDVRVFLVDDASADAAVAVVGAGADATATAVATRGGATVVGVLVDDRDAADFTVDDLDDEGVVEVDLAALLVDLSTPFLVSAGGDVLLYEPEA